MDHQLFEMFNQRMDSQDEMLREIKTTTKDTNTKIVEHESTLWWLKRLQWAVWGIIAAMLGVKSTH